MTTTTTTPSVLFRVVLLAVALAACLCSPVVALLRASPSASADLKMGKMDEEVAIPHAQLVFRLTPQSPHGDSALEEAFWEISTPGNKRFRQFLSLTEVCAMITGSKSSVEKVRNHLQVSMQLDWLNLQNSVCNDYIFVDLPADHFFIAAQNLMTDATNTGSIRKRATIAVPRELSADVQSINVVFPDTLEEREEKKKKKKETMKQQQQQPVGDDANAVVNSTSPFPGMKMNIYTMRSQYNFSWSESEGNLAAFNALNYSHAVAEFEQEQFLPTDVPGFNKGFPPLPRDPVISVDGPNKGGYFGEGQLDLEYIGGMAPNVRTWWVATSEFTINRWSERLLKITPLPSVVSISWGSGESTFPNSSLVNDNHDFKKMGVMGITVFAASGDQGTGSTNSWPFGCGVFDPTWPAVSPYVTAVGATYINSNLTTSTEKGWSGSGGGFSTKFRRPSYQSTVVNEYLNRNITFPNPKYWNSTGRATPDVSSLGCRADVFGNGYFGSLTGTSIATPSWAGMVSQINIDRLSANKTTLGFLNPALYAMDNGTVGFDVVEGDNKNPNCKSGFSASTGWDPVTGMGTPNFQLLKLFLME